MTPVYQLLANNIDVTANIRDRLVSLQITDNNGEQADTLTLELEDADGALFIPRPGATLQIKLGYEGRAWRDFGTFTFDEVRESSPPTRICITAKSACFAGASRDYAPMNDRKSRSWEAKQTIADIVKTIAGEAKLTPVITQTAAVIVLPHLDQTDESDLNFLTRLAEQNNSRCVPMYGKLIFAHMSDTRTDNAPEGSSREAVPVSRDEITTYEFTRKTRQFFESVTAVWRDIAGAVDVEERIGADDPTFAITGTYSDQRTAIKAAESKYLDLRRSGTTLDITMPAPVDLPFYAEGSINVTGIRPQIDGIWKLTQVDWNLNSGGLNCALKSEIAAPERQTEDGKGDATAIGESE